MLELVVLSFATTKFMGASSSLTQSRPRRSVLSRE